MNRVWSLTLFALLICTMCLRSTAVRAEDPIPRLTYFSFPGEKCTYSSNRTDVARIARPVTLYVPGVDTPAAAQRLQLFVYGTRLDTGVGLLSPNNVEFKLDRQTVDASSDEKGRNDALRKMWSRLLGSPFRTSFDGKRGLRDMPISLASDGRLLTFHCIRTDASGNKTSQDDPVAPMTLEVYGFSSMAFGLLFGLLVVAGTALLCRKTSMMRDTLVPQMRTEDRTLSLGRLQMAIWFCVVLASFVFTLTLTFDTGSINSETFVLLGISGATALGAIAVDKSKDSANPGPSDPAFISAALTAMGLVTRADTDRLVHEVEVRKNGAALATTVFPNAVITGNAAPTLADLLAAYRSCVAPIRSAGLRDLVNDANGPTIHRWQILIWTLLLAGIYVGRVYTSLETPTFGTNLLTLLGISGGVYLGFKIPEKQS